MLCCHKWLICLEADSVASCFLYAWGFVLFRFDTGLIVNPFHFCILQLASMLICTSGQNNKPRLIAIRFYCSRDILLLLKWIVELCEVVMGNWYRKKLQEGCFVDLFENSELYVSLMAASENIIFAFIARFHFICSIAMKLQMSHLLNHPYYWIYWNMIKAPYALIEDPFTVLVEF